MANQMATLAMMSRDLDSLKDQVCPGPWLEPGLENGPSRLTTLLAACYRWPWPLLTQVTLPTGLDDLSFISQTDRADRLSGVDRPPKSLLT